MIGFEDFLKVDIRAGTILSAEPFPEARKPAVKLTIDFGPEIGTKRSSAQITHNYAAPSLLGLQIMAVLNFPAKQIGPFISEVLVLGATCDDGSITLMRPDHPVPNGARLH